MQSASQSTTVYLGIDLGTSSVKAVLADEEGRELARAREPLELLTPVPHAAEQDPRAWWAAARAAIASCLRAAPDSQVAAVGLTGQKHAFLPLDSEGRPLAHAVLWADGTAQTEANGLLDRVPDLAHLTGAPPLAGYLVPKWLRWRARCPERASRTSALCFAKDWLRHCLTGRLATDRTEASASQLYDGMRHAWAPDLCRAFDVSCDLLPPVWASSQEAGRVGPPGRAATALPVGTPVVAGAGDNEAAALGCGAVERGVVALVLGTSGTVVARAAAQGPVGGLVWGEHVLEQGVAATGTVLSAGRALEWLRRTCFSSGASIQDVLAAAWAADLTSRGPLFVPTLEGERSPVPDGSARGAFVGLTASHGRSDLARAVLEGVAIVLGQTVDLLRLAGVEVAELRLTSKGASSRRWRRLIAAAARVPVRVAGAGEASARGAALLAACRGQGDVQLVERARAWARPGPAETPTPEEIERLADASQRLARARVALAGL